MQDAVSDPLSEAKKLIDRGELHAARLIASRELAIKPESAQALTLAGHAAIRTKDVAAAVRQFSRAACAGAGRGTTAALNLARAKQMAGDLRGALAIAGDAAARYPDEPGPRLFMAKLYVSSGHSAKAADCLKDQDLQHLDPDLCFVIGSAVGQLPGRAAEAVNLVARSLRPKHDRYAQTLDVLIGLTESDDPRRWRWLRQHLVLAPASSAGAKHIQQALARRSNLVRQAAWACHFACLNPDEVDHWVEAAKLAHKVKWPRHGIAAHRKLLDWYPPHFEIIERMCGLFELLDEPDEAKTWGLQLLDSAPEDPRIWDLIATLFKNIELWDDAHAVWKRILDRFREYHSLYHNYGLYLRERLLDDDALRSMKRAALLVPGYQRAWNIISMIRADRSEIDAAIREIRRCIMCGPGHPTPYLNYGAYIRGKGLTEEAIRIFHKAIALADNAEDSLHTSSSAKFNIGMTYLQIGEISTGFRFMEHRWTTRGFPSSKRNFRKAIWPGPIEAPNATVLAYMEQGLGDEFMYSWYFPLLRSDTSRLVIDCDRRLIDLYSRTFEGIEFVPRSGSGDPRAHDPAIQFKVPIAHVPQYYAPPVKEFVVGNWSLADRRGCRLPSRLTLDPDVLERWRDWRNGEFGNRPVVSVSWRSKVHNRIRDQQYVTPTELARTIPPGTVVVNLQYSTQDEEIAEFNELSRQFGFDFVMPPGVDLTNDLEDILAILQISDVAVTPLISLSWMGGAVGVPTLVFRTSREGRIWQQLGTPFVPWAPSIKLFIRDPVETWDSVIQRLNTDLAARLTDR